MKKIQILLILFFTINNVLAQKISASFGGGIAQPFIKVTKYFASSRSPMVKFIIPPRPTIYGDVKYQGSKKYGIGLNWVSSYLRYNVKMGPVVNNLNSNNRVNGYSTYRRNIGFSLPYYNLYGFMNKTIGAIDFSVSLGSSFFIMREWNNTNINNTSRTLEGLDHTIIYKHLVADDRVGLHIGLFYRVEASRKIGKRSSLFINLTGVKSWTTISTVPMEITVNNVVYDHSFIIKGSFLGCNIGYKYTLDLKRKKDKGTL